MYTKTTILALLIALTAFSTVYGVPVVTMYANDTLIYLPVDENILFVRFAGVGIEEGVSRALADYPDLYHPTDSQPGVEDFVVMGLNRPEQYDSIAAALRAEDYVGFVHPIIRYPNWPPIYMGCQIIVRFYRELSPEEWKCLQDEYHVVLLSENPYMSYEYLLHVTLETPVPVYTVANEIHEIPGVDYSHPNMYAYITWDKFLAGMELTKAVSAISQIALSVEGFSDSWYRIVRGIVDGDGQVDLNDLVYLINYVFLDGPAPVPHTLMGDANCDVTVDVGDIVRIIRYIFFDGAPPAICCEYQP